MLWNASGIRGYAIAASDGRLGTISDLLFDDVRWLVRWLVVDTGKWLAGREVLLPPSVLGPLDPHRTCEVSLTRQQVKDSPDIATHLPVSRQAENALCEHYGWVPYWGSEVFMPGYGYLGDAMADRRYLEPEQDEDDTSIPSPSEGDPHLRSVQAIIGHHIHARDGKIGHVEDMLLEEANWSIRYLVVDTKNWWLGKKVLISPRSVREIDWPEKIVGLDVDRQKVKNSPPYEASTTVDGAYEKRYHDYFYGDEGTDENQSKGLPRA